MNRHHAINYIEFTAPDLEAVKTFYSTVFGWVFTDYGSEYIAFSDGNLEGGFARGEARTRGALVILFSEDLTGTQTAIEAGGGSITTPTYDFPGGRRFHFSDPAGNELAVWALPVASS